MFCDFCDEWKGLETVYTRNYKDVNRIIYETKHFVVFPCMGQIRVGHLLIASKKHINAIGSLSKGEFKELNNLLKRVKVFFESELGCGLMCFEHGVINDDGSNGGCGVYHMHIHLVPASRIEFNAMLEKIKGCSENRINYISGIEETSLFVKNRQTYILFSFSDNDDNMMVITNEKNKFVSQYMRMVCCDIIGKETWDWRRIKGPETQLFQTLELGKAIFTDYIV